MNCNFKVQIKIITTSVYKLENKQLVNGNFEVQIKIITTSIYKLN